jgi:hypothetical protein
MVPNVRYWSCRNLPLFNIDTALEELFVGSETAMRTHVNEEVEARDISRVHVVLKLYVHSEHVASAIASKRCFRGAEQLLVAQPFGNRKLSDRS